jgi:hypothetical protein
MANISNNSSNIQNIQSNNKPKVNEMQGVYFSSSVKIFDPNTNVILVNIRGDR